MKQINALNVSKLEEEAVRLMEQICHLSWVLKQNIL